MQLDVAVDVRVTPDLHPQNVASLELYNDDTKGDLAQVVTAFDTAYQAAAKVYDARLAAANDITLTQPAQVLQTADFAGKIMQRATVAFDRASANMKAGITMIEKELTQPMEARASHVISQEIRTFVRGLKAEGKSPMDFVRRAIDSGDHDAVSAVLAAPAYLSGLEPQMQATLLRMWHEARNPVMAKRLRAMEAARDLLDRKASLIFKEIDKAVGYYEDPRSKRKIYPDELRKLRASSVKAFAQLGE